MTRAEKVKTLVLLLNDIRIDETTSQKQLTRIAEWILDALAEATPELDQAQLADLTSNLWA